MTRSASLLLRALRGEKTERPPVWLMRQAGRYQKSYRDLRAKVSMLQLCKTPDLAAQVTIKAVQDLDVDAAIIFSDLLLPLEPMGLSLEYAPDEGPRLSPPIRSAADVARLRPLDPERDMGFVLESLKRTRAALPEDMPLLGFAGAPFTLAAYMVEGGGSKNFQTVKTFMRAEPAAWRSLMEKLAAAAAALLNAQARAGADAVQLFDSWVGCLSPADYREHVLPHTRSVFQNLAPGLPAIYFGTQTAGLLELMDQAGAAALGLDWRVGLADARRRLGARPVMGNLDPAALLGPKEALRDHVRRILDENAGRPGFIFNLGHGVLPDSPFENVRYLVDTVKELS